MRTRRTSAFLIGLSTAALAAPAWGAAVTSNWNGGASGEWTTSGNWLHNPSSAEPYPNNGTDTFEVIIGDASVTFSTNSNVSVTSISMTASSGSLEVHPTATLSSGATTSDGAITVHSGASFSAGTLLINDNNLQVNGTLGVLSADVANIGGLGTINGNVTARAIISPGNDTVAVGILSINGNLTLEDSSSGISIELVDEAAYDRIMGISTATLAGGLSGIVLRDGPSAIGSGDRFDIVVATNAVEGAFDNVANGGRIDAFDMDDELAGTFRVNYGSTSVHETNMVVLDDFQAVPEPGAALLMGLAGPVLLARRRVRRPVRG